MLLGVTCREAFPYTPPPSTYEAVITHMGLSVSVLMASVVGFSGWFVVDLPPFIRRGWLRGGTLVVSTALLTWALWFATRHRTPWPVPWPLRAFGGVLAGIAALFLVYSTLLEIPWQRRHRPSPPPTLVTTGTYALCRHPGALWLTFFLLGWTLAFPGPEVVRLALVWGALELGVVWAQDRWTLPRRFPDYPAYRKRTPFAPDSPLIEILQKLTQGITVEQLAEMPEARGLWVKEWDALRTLRAEVLVPISVERDLVGFFTFGQRTDGVPYSQRELQHWLPHLARHVAIMVDNSRLYARVQAEATLLSRVNEELQELNRMKSHLLQNVSHELRTPLTLIIGYADLLRQKMLTGEKEIVEAGEVIRQNAQHLLHLVEQLLSFQKLDTTQMTLSPLDLPAFLRQVAKSWEPALKSQGLTLHLDIAADTGWVLANPDHLRQVLDNLLGNARKFSPEGTTISLRAWREGDTVYVSVSDQGIGIPPDKLDRIFERFYQVESAKRGEHGGMGIGLALCKEIIERHGGRIWAESEGEGKGATFTFTLHAVKPQQALSGNGQAAT